MKVAGIGQRISGGGGGEKKEKGRLRTDKTEKNSSEGQGKERQISKCL